MSPQTAERLVDLFFIYLACGAIFAMVFVWKWVGRLDPLARQGSIGFRVLLIPGTTALWPLFAFRLLHGTSAPPDEWTAHRARASEIESRR